MMHWERSGQLSKLFQRVSSRIRQTTKRLGHSTLQLLTHYPGTSTRGTLPAATTRTASSGRIWDSTIASTCNADERIAIEVEKSERKNVSDDLLKFQKGYRTQKDGRPKIEFGCLVVPVNYLGRHNLYQHSLTKLDFMKGGLFIDDVAVIGYRDPQPD